MNPIIVVVYWCLAGTSMDTFNPHQLDAVKKFMADHREQCHTEQTAMLDEPGLTIEKCKAREMVYYMPGWAQKETNYTIKDGEIVVTGGKIYVGGDCIPYRPDRIEPLDLQALKDRVTP